MSLLTDGDMRPQVKAGRLIEGLPMGQVDDFVHGCAVELHVGDIFRPGTKPLEAGSADSPRERYVLAEGETAVIRTVESFKLDPQHTALVLPVGTVSLQGLLMTNPGQVDPGYEGQIHVTVINMGKQPYMLRKGDRLLRALIFKLHDKVEKAYQATAAAPAAPAAPAAAAATGAVGGGPVRMKRADQLRWLMNKLDELCAKPASPRGPINQELLDTLSPDFLSVNARVSEGAKSAVASAASKATFWQIFTPAIAAVLLGGISAYVTNVTVTKDFERRIVDLETQKAGPRLIHLESDLATEKRFNSIEDSLREIKQQLPRTPAETK